FGDADPGNTLLDVIIDSGHRSRSLASDNTREPPKTQSDADDDGNHDHKQESQTPFPAHQDKEKHNDLKQLGNNIGGNQNNLAEFLSVAGDSADHLAGFGLIVKGQVTINRSGKGIFPHLADDISHQPPHQPPTHSVGHVLDHHADEECAYQ